MAEHQCSVVRDMERLVKCEVVCEKLWFVGRGARWWLSLYAAKFSAEKGVSEWVVDSGSSRSFRLPRLITFNHFLFVSITLELFSI